jgi:NAD(P)H-hydrate repair Nnr-like enzyme with NAD(P)H-hydrate epimerase domain
VIPVVTPLEMAEVDRSAPEPVEVLVGRAGAAVAAEALRVLGGAYGHRVVVIAGGGNNGADGRSAAALLSARGAKVVVVAPDVGHLPTADLVIDAAYGTGLSRPYRPPEMPSDGRARVLAVDIPSGIEGATGGVPEGGSALRADVTVTFGSLKPGLLLGAGPAHTGRVRVAGIGLAAAAAGIASAWLVTDDDVAAIPSRSADGHKWQSALGVVAGSPGMTGAPWMLSTAAMRAGAGYVRLGIPGVAPGGTGLPPGEAVGVAVTPGAWVEVVRRCRAFVVGPGLGPLGGAGVEAGTGDV